MSDPFDSLTLAEVQEVFNALKVAEVNQRACDPAVLDRLLQRVGSALDRLRYEEFDRAADLRTKGDLLRAAGAVNVPAPAPPALKDCLGLPSFAAGNDPEDRAGVSGLPPALTTRVDKAPSPLPRPEDFHGLPVVRRMFAVIEYSSFYAVRHLPTSAECPMGDGVDALFFKDEEHEEGQARMPGTAGFVREWEDALNANPQETLGAYFPELLEQEES